MYFDPGKTFYNTTELFDTTFGGIFVANSVKT